MDVQAIMIAKDLYKDLKELCDLFDRKGLWDRRGIQVPLSTIFQADILRFLLYLSAADGTLNEQEIQVFQAITDVRTSADEMIHLTRMYDLTSARFEASVPASFQIVTEAERKAIALGAVINSKKNTQEIFAEFFAYVGDIMVHADGAAQSREQRNLDVYLNTLRQYMRNTNG